MAKISTIGRTTENDYSSMMEILTSQHDSVRAASGSWQQQMKWAVRDLESLRQCLELPENSDLGAAATKHFPVFVPRPFLSRMERGNVDDPLLRQVLPLPSEDASPDRFTVDPLDEAAATLTPGLLQKYEGRVLLVTTGACAIHCRYCFRRHFPYSEAPSSLDQWLPAIEKIRQDTSIEEVILSGGDPLTIVDATLTSLVEKLSAIQHISRIRIHTRLPIMIPQRITDELLAMIRNYSGQSIIVIHANHENEFDDDVDEALSKLRAAGATLLNQTVLLRGVNDSADSLIALSKRLMKANVLPYYLHQLDPITGTSHFEVNRERGRELIAKMRASLPGYAVPRYVKELAGENSKTIWE